MLNLLASQDPSFLMPNQASNFAKDVDFLFYYITVTCTIMTVIVVGLMAIFTVKYRQKDRDFVPEGPTHNTAVELAWSTFPAFVLASFFILGYIGYNDMASLPEDSDDADVFHVQIIGKKWQWDYKYDNGFGLSHDLVVPGNTPVVCTLTSDNVLHSYYIPAMRVKKDVVPGRYNRFWFTPEYDEASTESAWLRIPDVFDTARWEAQGVSAEEIEAMLGTDPSGNAALKFKVNYFQVFCAEYCGDEHGRMWGRLVVIDPRFIDVYLDVSSDRFYIDSPVDAGRGIFESQCRSCHAAGSYGGGSSAPDWQLLLNEGRFENDAALLDHINESVRDPNAVIADGYASPSAMSSFADFTPDQMYAVYAFIQSLGENATLPESWGEAAETEELRSLRGDTSEQEAPAE